MNADFAKARDIFLAALEITDATARCNHITDACGSDNELRQHVELLLEAHGQPATFIEQGALAPSITEKPGDTIGPYKLLQQIGEGGMGVVYMADQTEPVKRRVALKIIKPGMDTRQVIARFEAERQALAMMDHPNIAKALDAGATSSGRPYFVMELVNGVPLTAYCDEQRLTPKERLKLFVQVCRAVQHAHQKGVIHRDLKPSNILVAEYDNKAVPKVIDFGVAKATSQTLTEKTMFTQLGQIVGTLDYMSPEQAKRNQLDADTRSDVYSLGVILYELLTGETPFDKQRLRSAGFDEMLRIIREEEPPRPSTKLSSSQTLPSIAANRRVESQKLSGLVRGELDWIVMKALEKERNRRYQTANGFAADIDRYLADEPVEACPPSVGYRLRKFTRRNQAAIVTAVLVAGSLIVGTVSTSWQAILATKERDRAVAAESLARRRFESEQQQRQRAEHSEEKAITMRQLADRRFRVAIDHLNGYVEFVGHNQDLKRRFPTLQQNLLGQSAPFYAKLIEASPTDDSLKVPLVLAFLHLGIVHSSIGEHDAAIVDYRNASAVIEQFDTDSSRGTSRPPAIEPSTSVLHLKAGSQPFTAELQARYEQALSPLHARVSEFDDVPEYAELLSRAESTYATWLGRHRNWEDSLGHFVHAIQLKSDDLYSCRCTAILLVKTDQIERYATFCQQVHSQFPSDDEGVPKMLSLHPTVSALLSEYAEITETVAGDAQQQGILRNVAGINKGICEYRSGNLATAIRWLRRYKDKITGDINPVRARLFLAMALARTGRCNEARQCLVRADQLKAEHDATCVTIERLESGQMGSRWHEILGVEILRREAVDVLEMMDQHHLPGTTPSDAEGTQRDFGTQGSD